MVPLESSMNETPVSYTHLDVYKRQVTEEPFVGFEHGVEIGVIIDMVPVCIGHYGHVGTKKLEGPITFIKFGDHVGSLPQLRVPADVAELPAYGDGGVEPSILEDQADH